MTLRVPVKRLPHAEGLPLPAYQTPGSAGLDLMAAIKANSIVVIEPGARELVPTGLVFELPNGFEAQVRPRSGLALKSGVTVLNAPGTIDADYRGEIGVILINHGAEPFEVTRGMRIAQLIISPVSRAMLLETDSLGDSVRGGGGFGSTGAGTL